MVFINKIHCQSYTQKSCFGGGEGQQNKTTTKNKNKMFYNFSLRKLDEKMDVYDNMVSFLKKKNLT